MSESSSSASSWCWSRNWKSGCNRKITNENMDEQPLYAIDFSSIRVPLDVSALFPEADIRWPQFGSLTVKLAGLPVQAILK